MGRHRGDADGQSADLSWHGLLERMRDASEDFQLPEWACNSYRTLFGELEAMEGDILRHVHLENHVLMARYA